ncbi:response regulator [Pseudonocardia oroxyli]|uniref:Transcriptional regulatory protein KdpE n=1 Tax=Pseudonocardia oroxyli TaxID=366584 RepID=A0A1G7XWT9_PSEOR|nr:response regulator [Pseudonocardia oroxyli]SDG88648.1 two-component system, OmpR family, KDP operon response regulator KdpE [Pseudonocardia oroxyli]
MSVAERAGARAAETGAVRVLVVDDDPQILRALRINLSAHGYHVTTARDGRSALTSVGDVHPDLVVLDLGLPDLDGTEVITGLRAWTRVPIVVLSARADSVDKVTALDAGADDYVTKPFGMAELLARLRAAVRRSATATGGGDSLVEFADVEVDLARKRVRRAGADVHLTPTEWEMLELLVQHRGRLVSQRDLLRHVWGPRREDRTNYLRVYLAQLRRKLEPDPSRPRHLITEPGMGYRFESTPDSMRDALRET